MFSSVLFASIVTLALGFPSGPPIATNPDLCTDMIPTGHGATAQDSTPPYEYTMSSTCYKAGTKVEVMIKSTHEDEASRYFEGYFTQVQENGVKTANYGVFTTDDTEWSQVMDCHGNTGSVVAQKAKEHFVSRIFTWTAPDALTSAVHFRSTIVKSKTTFWVDYMSDALTYDVNCVEKTLGNVTAEIQDRSSGSHETTEETPTSSAPAFWAPLLVSVVTIILALTLP